ncbi:OsmC family protein [Asanoa sp. NPDC050611]|uniref:OsmC family protein n=1 Tax=Asanoa sp. NPDC050611 TaxID=3157098 RepID=UPI0033D8D57A
MGYHVEVERTDDGGYVARNGRGAEIRFGTADGADFTPVELLLAALGGCNIVTVEPLTAQRGHRLERLAAVLESEKVKPNRLGPITMTYDVTLPKDDAEAEPVFRAVAERVHERHCTVSTALREQTTVDVEIPETLTS